MLADIRCHALRHNLGRAAAGQDRRGDHLVPSRLHCSLPGSWVQLSLAGKNEPLSCRIGQR